MFFLLSFTLPSYLFSHLFLFDAFIDFGCGVLMGPEQTDNTGPLRFQDVTILVSNHLVQLEDPVVYEARQLRNREIDGE